MKELTIVENITNDFAQGLSISVLLFFFGIALIGGSPLIGIFLLATAFFIYSKALSKSRTIEKITADFWRSIRISLGLFFLGMVPGIILEIIFRPLSLGYIFFLIAAVYIFSKAARKKFTKK